MLASDLISEVIAKLRINSISIRGRDKNPTAPTIILYSCKQAHYP